MAVGLMKSSEVVNQNKTDGFEPLTAWWLAICRSSLAQLLLIVSMSTAQIKRLISLG
jgi:hypothetical protein